MSARNKFLLIILLTFGCGSRHVVAQTTGIMPLPKMQFFSNSGAPLAGGKVYTYITATTTPLATYTDATGGTPNTNPVILDSAGRANIWLTPGSAYRIVLKTSLDVTIWTVDGITAASILGGSGTGDKVAKFTSATVLGNSTITDTASLTTIPNSTVVVNGSASPGATWGISGLVMESASGFHVMSGTTADEVDLNLRADGITPLVVFDGRKFGAASYPAVQFRVAGAELMRLKTDATAYLTGKMRFGDQSMYSGSILDTVMAVNVRPETNPTSHYAVSGYYEWTPAANTSDVAAAVAGFAHLWGSSQMAGNLVGVDGIVSTQPGSTANVTGNLIGVYGRPAILGSGTVTSAAGVQAQGPILESGGSGNVTNAYGVQIIAALSAGGSGTVTNNVALRIEPLGSLGTNKWAIQAVDGDSYLGGRLTIGQAATPSAALDVQGTTTTVGIWRSTGGSVRTEFWSNGTQRGNILADNAKATFAYQAGFGVSVSTADVIVTDLGTYGTAFKVDATSSSTLTNTYIGYNGTLKQIQAGAADSCTAGFRCLRISN